MAQARGRHLVYDSPYDTGERLTKRALWLELCDLLVREPHLRTCLTIPDDVVDEYWAVEAARAWCEKKHRGVVHPGPMCIRGLRQTTLTRRVVWLWDLQKQ